MQADHPSLDLVIITLLVGIAVMGVMSFLIKPAYESSVNIIVLALTNAFSGACGAKYGLSQANKPIDTASLPADKPKEPVA